MYKGTVDTEYINANELLNSVSQELLFFKYLGIYPETGKYYLSPFRKDNSPGCRFIWHSGLLYFVENSMFNGKLYWSIIDVVKYLKGCSYIQALNIIAKEENINIREKEEKSYNRKRPEIRFNYKPWESNNLFELPNDILQKENTYLVTDYWITNKEGQFIKNGIHNPRKSVTIAYHFPDSNHVKLYFPFEEENRWFSNCDNRDVFGKYMLDYYKTISDYLVITKSQKDRLTLFYHFNIPTIATQNEGSYFEETFIDNVKNSFSNVYILFDNDNSGKIAASALSEKYGLTIINVPEDDFNSKDIYEYKKNNTLR